MSDGFLLISESVTEGHPGKVACATGVARPVSLLIETFGTEKIARPALAQLVRDHFDLRPAALIETLNLRRPIYRQTPVVVSRLIPVIRTIAGSGTGILLIGQFATVAPGLAHRARIMGGGRIRHSGLASDLRDQPGLLRSVYLLQGSEAKPPPYPLVYHP